MSPNAAALGRAVRRLRRERHISIERLSFAADIHPTYMSGIERGVRNPTWRVVTAIARALDVPLATLAQDAEREAQFAQRTAAIRVELGMPV
jgi:transcriptional regulator with XRE-family HTH domain